jgi:hypothetical protein
MLERSGYLHHIKRPEEETDVRCCIIYTVGKPHVVANVGERNPLGFQEQRTEDQDPKKNTKKQQPCGGKEGKQRKLIPRAVRISEGPWNLIFCALLYLDLGSHWFSWFFFT